MNKTQYMPECMMGRLKEIIYTSPLSVKEIAKQLGVARSTLYRWMEENTPPSSTELARICELFDVSADYLLFGIKKGVCNGKNT